MKLRGELGASRQSREDRGSPWSIPGSHVQGGSTGHRGTSGCARGFPGLSGVSYACPDVHRPTRTFHPFTRPIGLRWPRCLNDMTTCAYERAQSVSIVCYQHDLECLEQDIVRGSQGRETKPCGRHGRFRRSFPKHAVSVASGFCFVTRHWTTIQGTRQP